MNCPAASVIRYLWVCPPTISRSTSRPGSSGRTSSVVCARPVRPRQMTIANRLPRFSTWGESFLKFGVLCLRDTGESVPRAVASVTPGANPQRERRSLPLAVLIRRLKSSVLQLEQMKQDFTLAAKVRSPLEPVYVDLRLRLSVSAQKFAHSVEFRR